MQVKALRARPLANRETCAVHRSRKNPVLHEFQIAGGAYRNQEYVARCTTRHRTPSPAAQLPPTGGPVMNHRSPAFASFGIVAAVEREPGLVRGVLPSGAGARRVRMKRSMADPSPRRPGPATCDRAPSRMEIQRWRCGGDPSPEAESCDQLNLVLQGKRPSAWIRFGRS